MSKAIIVALVSVLALGATTVTAEAAGKRSVRYDDPKVGWDKHELRQQIWRSSTAVKFFNGHRWLLMPKRATCGKYRVCKVARQQLRAHGWLLNLSRERLQIVKQKERERARALAAARTTSSAGSSGGWLWDAFMCIHRYEGPWDANTGNGYEGGLQFGHTEWQTYGGQYASRAYYASPSQQIAAGIAYYRVSGFSPWPNTARACGLL